MTNKRPQFGIITALQKEFLPMVALLENPIDESFPGTGAGTEYKTGTIPALSGGEHEVVVALLPSMGTNMASQRATLLLSHYPTVDYIIMVGIAGGVPNPQKTDEHVRLGDIVLSGPYGVVQYDFVKRGIKETERRHPPRPPSAKFGEIQNMLTTDIQLGSSNWTAHITFLLDKINIKRPRTDLLHDSKDQSKKLTHPRDPDRKKGLPKIFSGTIASSNALLKDPILRDKLRDKFNVRAVEMEASGIADTTWVHDKSYYVIRGICDYCDSHKGDSWQKYAAVVAAAYTRALIERFSVDPTRKSFHNEAEIAEMKQEMKILQLENQAANNRLLSFEGQFEREFEEAKALRNSKRVDSALERFQSIERNQFAALSDKNKYKLLANIGICYLDRIENEEASKHFIKALQYNPEDASAQSYYALGNALIGRREVALDFSNKSISKDPFNTNAYIVKIWNSSPEQIDDLLKEMPNQLKESGIILSAISTRYEILGDIAKAIQYLRQALPDQKSENSDHLYKMHLGGLILKKLELEKGKFDTAIQASDETRRELLEAKELFNSVWESVKSTELRNRFADSLFNRGVISRMLGDYEAAEIDFREVLGYQIHESAATKELGVIQQFKGDKENALRLFQEALTFPNEDFGLRLMVAEALLMVGQPANAIALLDGCLISSSDDTIKLGVADMLSLAYANENMPEKLEELRLLVEGMTLQSILKSIILSRIFRFKNETDKADALLKDAMILISQEDNLQAFRLGFELGAAKLYEDAIICLEHVVGDNFQNNDPTMILAELYFQTKCYKKLIPLLQNIREKLGFIDFFMRLEINMSSDVGDSTRLIELLEVFVQQKPDDASTQLGLLQAYLNNLRNDDMAKHLKNVNSEIFINLSVGDGFRAAGLYMMAGFSRESLELAYSIRRKNHHSEEAHAKYLIFIIELGSQIQEVFSEKVEALGANCGVQILDKSTEKTSSYIIVSDNPQTLEEKNVDDYLIKEVIGKTAGSIISIKAPGKNREFQIISVSTKFETAYHNSLHVMDTQFPYSKLFSIIRLSENPEKNILADLSALLPETRDEEDYRQRLKSMYEDNALPFPCYYKFLTEEYPKVSPISLFKELIYGNDTLSSSQHVYEELNISAHVIASKIGVVLDITTLMMVHELSLQEIFEKHLDSISILEPNINFIRNEIFELERDNKRAHGFLRQTAYGPKGNFFEAGDFDHMIKNLKQMLTWSEKFSVSAAEQFDLDKEKNEELFTILPKSFLATVMHAKNSQTILFIEDGSSRTFAKSLFGVSSIDLFSFVDSLYRLGKINFDAYIEKAFELTKFNYPIQLNFPVLKNALERLAFSSPSEFAKLIRLFGGRYLELEYATVLLARFLCEIYKLVNLADRRFQLVNSVLFSFFADRFVSSELVKQIFSELRREFPIVMQLQLDEANRTVALAAQSLARRHV